MVVASTVLHLPDDGRQSAAALRIQRGVRRYLLGLGYVCVPEVTLRSGRRADLVAIGPQGTLWIIEVKSSIADFRADQKWPDYLRHCDKFSFATGPDVTTEIFPVEAGLIVADAYGADSLRAAPEFPLAAATRKEMLIRLSRHMAAQLQRLTDPQSGVPDGY